MDMRLESNLKAINNTILLYWAASVHYREVGGVDGCLEFGLELLVRVRVRVGLGLRAYAHYTWG